jgi:bacillithiol synthase
VNPEILVRIPSGGKLARDHGAGDPAASERFGGHFGDLDAYRQRASALESRFDRAARERAARAIRAPHPAGEARLARVVQGGGFFVTTGQQPGLFTGPLYSLYKALTAVRLADALEVRLGVPVAPLFWIASEDHDWAEVDHTWLVDRENALTRFALPGVPGGIPNRPLFRYPLDGAIDDLLERFAAALPPSEFVAADLELLRRWYVPGRTLGEAFGGVLGELLGSHGLLFVDSSDPALKEASLPLLLTELERSAESEACLARSAAHLEAQGYDLQVPILEGGVNLFLEGPGGRERIYRDGSGFMLRRSGERLSRADIGSRVLEDPGVLSPNALLRPLVESHVFPVLSYVAGPGETAYWGQLRELFALHDVAFPMVHPRLGATLVEGKVRKVLDRFGLPPEALGRPLHELAGELLRDEMPDAVRGALGEYRGAVARSAGALAAAVKPVDATLKGPVEGARNQALMALEEVERKIVQALRRQNEVGLEQLGKAAVHLFPEGAPQERVFNPFYYTARFGRPLVDALLERFAPPLAAGPVPETAQPDATRDEG